MSSVSKKQIMPYVNLTCINTQKFKTGCLSVNLLTKLDGSTASKNALLPRVLRRGTAMHPDMQSIAAELDNLYGARIEPEVRKKGEVQSVGFYADFVDDDFVSTGENILEKTANLIGEMLLAPKTKSGNLKPEYVESERNNLIDEIRAEINDKRSYSVKRLIKLMCSDEAFGVNCLGSERDAKKITASGLTKHYKNLIATSPIEIIYCGSAEPERVERAMLNALSSVPRTDVDSSISTDVKLAPPSPDVRSFTDKLDVTQGKLALGFRLGDIMKEPNYAAITVFNAIFGGSVTSKLFLNVREKMSLCYFASSMIEKHKGVMVVSSGIEFENKDKALDEILLQLEAIKNGNIEPWELDGAKRAVITSLKTLMDQPYRIEDYFLDQTINELQCMPDEMAALVGCVSVEDVMKVASGVKLDSVYFLEGK